MARNGNPDDEYYGEPTQYADYSGSGGQAYSEPTQYGDYGSGGQAYSEYPRSRRTNQAATRPVKRPHHNRPNRGIASLRASSRSARWASSSPG